LLWQIGLGYNIIISASSAVTMGCDNQMKVRLTGGENLVTLDRDEAKSKFAFVEMSKYTCDFLHTTYQRNVKEEMGSSNISTEHFFTL